ncbi:MAG: hypothetical protein O7F15_07340 [Gammaproteobacteria bacterium]|nr:hypothetical protein [Gammaproteobacteria bacterium]MCZ6668438.1 hypothetical protein [Gammaproteobacteria bacterium]MCZ6882799.1 hypothetical protein [Gammaproteobacteria bacterium]
MKKSQGMIQTIQKRPRGRPRSIITDTKPGTVRALDRGLTLLRELAQVGSIRLTDLAIRADMPSSSTNLGR